MDGGGPSSTRLRSVSVLGRGACFGEKGGRLARTVAPRGDRDTLVAHRRHDCTGACRVRGSRCATRPRVVCGYETRVQAFPWLPRHAKQPNGRAARTRPPNVCVGRLSFFLRFFLFVSFQSQKTRLFAIISYTRDCLCASLHKSVGIEQKRWYRSVRTTVNV